MHKFSTVTLMLALAAPGYAAAADASLLAAKKEADTRYAADKKLCAEETTSASRMQCLRDAKSEYDKAIAAAKAAPAPVAAKPPPVVIRTAEPAARPPQPACAECGRVVEVKTIEQEGEGGALGVIAGGVAGAVLGHQVGQGHGKDLATIAGAAGGAYAGHKIEQNMRKVKTWSVKVELDSGEERSFSYKADPGYIAGDLVKLSGSGLVRR